jgi:hypothetical protein
MNENRSFASLEPTLLARKGGAKPAMRPQVGLTVTAQPLPPTEDLGWNDTGEAHAYEDEGEVVTLAPAKGNGSKAPIKGKPAVRQQIEAIAAHLARRDKKHDRERASALENGRRAAFTLRLDAQRHLKLRLACTVKNRSAQQIVTEALDRLLGSMPEVDSLAAQVKKR